MAKVGDVVRLALNRLTASPLGQSAEAEYAEAALEHYNDMMRELADSFDIVVSDDVVYVHTEQSVGDDLQLDGKYKSGLSALLAIRLAPIVSLEDNLTRETVDAAARLYGRMSGDFIKKVQQDRGILRRRRYF